MRIPNRFQYQQEDLGEGTFGVVRAYVDTEHDDRRVAIKEFKSPWVSRLGWSVDCVRENAFLTLAVGAPHLVQMHEVCSERTKNCFVVLERMKQSLYRHLRSPGGKRLSDPEVLTLTKGLLTGLEWLHDNGLMHRDLKPQNVLVNDALDECKISDFGSMMEDVPGRRNTLCVCTRPFCALEILYGDERYTKKVDVWSMGCILYEMVAGRTLFESDGTSVDQVRSIAYVIGSPSEATWPGIEALPYFTPDFPSPGWEPASKDAVDADPSSFFRPGTVAVKVSSYWMRLIRWCLSPSSKRPTATELKRALNGDATTSSCPTTVTSGRGLATSKVRTSRRVVEKGWRASIPDVNSILNGLADVHDRWKGRARTFEHAYQLLARRHETTGTPPRDAEALCIAALLVSYKLWEADLGAMEDWFCRDADSRLERRVLSEEDDLLSCLKWDVVRLSSYDTRTTGTDDTSKPVRKRKER